MDLKRMPIGTFEANSDDMTTLNKQWEEHYSFLENDYKKALKHILQLQMELDNARDNVACHWEEEIRKLKEEIILLKNPPKRKIGDRGKQKTLHYKVVNNLTGEEKLFHTMKDIATEYGMSASGINQHIRNWKIKKFEHFDIFYLNKKN